MEINDVLNILRLTQAEINALGVLDAGTMVYNTTTNSLEVYNGASWTPAGGGGGGKDLYPEPAKARIHQFAGATAYGTFTDRTFNGRLIEVPLCFNGDVILQKVECRQTNASSSATTNGGRIGIYKYNSESGTNFLFDKVYQEPQTFNFSSALVNTDQEITLTTPQTLEAGEVYIIAIVDDYPNNDANAPTLYCYSGINNPRMMLGVGFINNTKANSLTSLLSNNVTITSGVMASSISFIARSFNRFEGTSRCLITLQNA